MLWRPFVPESVVGKMEGSKSLPEAWQKLYVYRTLELQGLSQNTIAKIAALPDVSPTPSVPQTVVSNIEGSKSFQEALRKWKTCKFLELQGLSEKSIATIIGLPDITPTSAPVTQQTGLAQESNTPSPAETPDPKAKRPGDDKLPLMLPLIPLPPAPSILSEEWRRKINIEMGWTPLVPKGLWRSPVNPDATPMSPEAT